MRVSYNKLWKLLIDKEMNKTALMTAVKMSPSTIAKMGKNENVSMDVIARICEYLNCDVGDVMEMISEEGDSSEAK
ncbi:MAG: helix-turn-helix transcriptional regulator [Lachnospiraceae bacterium]|nr:helix-turn-helix transcriptional regulator [Lachnospiraceae bacterium]